MWDQRFAEPEFTYGKEPNDFLASLSFSEHSGEVYCLAEGQGRNAVYLARLGFDVTAVDLSKVGLERSKELAAERGVSIQTLHADLGKLSLPPHTLDGIVMIFGHTPPQVRRHVHQQIVQGLRPGGFLVLEGYRKEQLQYKTGGPPSEPMLYSLEELMEDLDEYMDWTIARETEREVVEGAYHTGLAAVVQLYGIRKG